MTDDDARERMLREVATLSARYEEIMRRISSLEEAVTGAKAALLRISWVIMLALAGNLIGKYVGLSALMEVLKKL